MPKLKYRLSRKSGLAWVLTVVFVGGFAWQSHVWSFLCDDAFISFRYARNWAEFGKIVYNVEPLEFVEGYTNPLWVAILALGNLLGVAPHRSAPILTRAFAVAAIFGCVALASLLRQIDWSGSKARDEQEKPWLAISDLGAAALLITVPQFMVWSSSGLETSLVAALAVWSVVTFLMRRTASSAILLVLTGLTRLDGLIWPSLWIFGLLGARHFSGEKTSREQIPWISYAGAMAIVIAPLLIHFAWRQSYYGSLLPNTWWIKQHGMMLSDSWGTWYLRSWAYQLGLIWMLPLLLAVRIRHVYAIVPTVAVLLYVWRVGGDFMAYHRFLLPATMSWAILLSWLSREFAHKFQKPIFRNLIGMIPFIAAIVFIGLLPARLERDQNESWIDGRWESTAAMDRFAKIRFAAGHAMRKVVRDDENVLVSVGAAGAFPYASNFSVFDVYGLVDPDIAKSENHVELRAGKSTRPGHQIVATSKYIRSRQPDLQCHNGWAAEQRPSRKLARRRAGKRYGWLCAQTGPIEERRSLSGKLDSHYYCCLTKKERRSQITQEVGS